MRRWRSSTRSRMASSGSGWGSTLRFAGAESNFAIALARLGVDVAWVSRLGRDPFGDLIIEAGLAHEGVDLRWVTRDAAPTGLFCKWRSGRAQQRRLPTRGLSGLAATSGRRAGRGARGGGHRAPDRDHDGDLGERTRARAGRRRRARRSAARCVLFDPNFRPALPDTPAGRRGAPAGRAAHTSTGTSAARGEAELLWPDGEIPVRSVIRVGAPRRDRRRRRGAAAADAYGRRRGRRRRRFRGRLRLRPAAGVGADRLRSRRQRHRRGARSQVPATGRRCHASPRWANCLLSPVKSNRAA